MKWLLAKRYTVNIIFLLVGVGVVIFYALCGDACAYLQGGILGIDLKYLGLVFVAALILFNILKRDLPILMLLSAGMGAEVFLIGYQVVHNTYCPYCLVFAMIVVAQFLFNMDRSRKLLVLVCMALGFSGFLILFKGSAFPVYSMTPIPTVSSVKTV